MRRTDDMPLDPEIAAQLDAIDATLAGDPVDPQYAELAELALLLTAERPSVDPAFASSLDERVARRFEGHGSRGFVSPAADGDVDAGSRWRRLWDGDWLAPLGGLLAGCVGILVAVFVLGGGGGSVSGSSTTPVSAPSSAGSSSGSAAASAGASRSAAGAQKAPAPEVSHGASKSSAVPATSSSSAQTTPAPTVFGAPGTSSSSANAASSSTANAAAGSASVQPAPNGRKIAQSAQLALGTAPSHLDDVAQEVFNVAGREHAVVNSSNVTAGAGGYAEFQLSVPSSSLAATMTALSQLPYATVNSRTDSSQDVNGQYLYDNRKLRDDQALRTSLLKQLGNATTQEQINSLNARIHDAEDAITKDEAVLRGINHKIGFSPVTVTINQAAVPVGTGHSGGHSGSSFTLGKAAHDAGRVLTVVAGIVLITLAALLPVALIGLLAWWIASSVRRRRREQALDLA